MANIPLIRGPFLLPFVSILDDVGAPTETLLEKFWLPSSLAEKSDLYLPLLPALRFVETARRTQGIEDWLCRKKRSGTRRGLASAFYAAR
ncbi:hypothetical protein AB4144_38305, partial [Rhizobiaceae sp. 2RAB30]